MASQEAINPSLPQPSVSSVTSGASTASYVSGSTTAVSSILDEATIRRCIHAFFDWPIPASGGLMHFLHRSITLADWSRGRLDPRLLKAIVASGLQISEEHHYQSTALAQAWIGECQEALLRDLDHVSIVRLQVLILVIRFRLGIGEGGQAWNLLPIAARLAFTMRLNHEASGEGLDAPSRESRRRLM